MTGAFKDGMMLILYGVTSILIRIKGIKAEQSAGMSGLVVLPTHIGQTLPYLSTFLWRPVSASSQWDPVRNRAMIRLRCSAACVARIHVQPSHLYRWQL